MQLESGEDLRKKSNVVFSRSPPAPIGPDGIPLKISVCDEILESVRKAADIEKQLQNAKVLKNMFYFLLLTCY